MTSSSLAAEVEVQLVRYVLPASTHVQSFTAPCVAPRFALWREDCPHRGIRKTRRYLRKRWWVSFLWWFAYAHIRPVQAACRRR